MDGDTSRNSTQTNYRNLTVDDESDAYESCRRLLDETVISFYLNIYLEF